MGAVPSAESPDALTGVALTSPDGLHWTSVALPDPDAQGLPWGADGLLVGPEGWIAHGSLFAAPGAEVWWQSNDGQRWRLVPNYAPLGVSQAPVGRGADGMLVSDGTRILAVQFGGGAWESFDGQRWNRLAITGESPGNQGVLLPGGVLLLEPTTDGANVWIGEASAK